MEKTNKNSGGMMAAILSLSLLTVMAGAAVAPALNVIQDFFNDEPGVLVQMIISIPAIFIVITNLAFPALAARFRAKGLLLAGLVLYVAGGSVAGIFDNIYAVLAARALVGIGVGIVMPMSTGLLAFYYPRDMQDRLMGYSSAMNQLGGSVATLIAGFLAAVSWRLSFLVYLMGLISIILCLLFLPNDRISERQAAERREPVFRNFFPYIGGLFIVMFAFFVYPANFAIETAKDGIIPQQFIGVIMAFLDLLGFAGGLAYVHIRKKLKWRTRFLSPILFVIGYGLLAAFPGWFGAVLGSLFIGFASGEGIPFIISSAAMKAGKNAGSTVLPLISAALYLSQFTAPMILSGVQGLFGALGLHAAHVPYLAAVFSGILLFFWSFSLGGDRWTKAAPEGAGARQAG